MWVSGGESVAGGRLRLSARFPGEPVAGERTGDARETDEGGGDEDVGDQQETLKDGSPRWLTQPEDVADWLGGLQEHWRRGDETDPEADVGGRLRAVVKEVATDETGEDDDTEVQTLRGHLPVVESDRDGCEATDDEREPPHVVGQHLTEGSEGGEDHIRDITSSRHNSVASPAEPAGVATLDPALDETVVVTTRLFGTLCGFVFLVNFGRVAFAPLVEPLQAAFGVGPAAVGFVISLVWWGSALPRIPVGVLLTRVPRHRVVLGTGVLLTVAAAFTASATSLVTLQVGAFCVGLASGAYFVSAVPLLGELYPESVGRVVGIHGMASQLAAVVVPTLAVVVLAQASWRAVFWLLAAAALAVTVVLAVVADGGSVPTNDDADRDFLAALAHWRVILLGVVMVAALGFVWQGLFNFYVPYMTGVKNLSPATAGTMLTVVFAAGVPAFLLSGRLADRLPNVPYILAIHLAFVVCLVALTVVSSRAALFAVTAALGYVIHSLFPALDTYVLGVLPADNRAAAYAVFSGVALLLEAGGSGVVGYLTEVGLAFDAVFLAFAVGLTAVLVGLTGLYAADAFPRSAAESVDVETS